MNVYEEHKTKVKTQKERIEAISEKVIALLADEKCSLKEISLIFDRCNSRIQATTQVNRPTY